MMTSSTIVECIKRQLTYKPINITFKRDGQIGFRMLLLLSDCKQVTIQGTDKIKVVTMFKEDYPNEDENRTITVFHFNNYRDKNLEVIADDVQSISTSPHVASELFSIIDQLNYQKDSSSFKGIVEKFVEEVLNQPITDLVSSMGYSVTGHFVCFDSLPAIVFTVTDKTGNILVNIAVDSWSGRYCINGMWSQTTLRNKEDIRQRIYSATVDAITALKTVAA